MEVKKERLDIIEEKLDRILYMLEENKRVQDKLEQHIVFIEKTYEQLHTPLTFMKNSVMRIIGRSDANELEHIK
jgi:hypothetical protein